MPYGGYGGPTPNERDITVKLLFLAEIRSLMVHRSPPKYELFLDALMGQPPYGEKVFDLWWTFEQNSEIAEFREHISNISLEQFDLIAVTSLRGVDDWIERLRELKENGEI